MLRVPEPDAIEIENPNLNPILSNQEPKPKPNPDTIEIENLNLNLMSLKSETNIRSF